MKRIASLVALALAAWLPQVASAQAPATPGDPNRGAQMVRMCQGCHGIPGWRTAFPEVYRVPKLSGQNPAYIVAALKEYKAGNRSHPSMRAIAASLDEQEMADLAAYYALAPLTTATK